MNQPVATETPEIAAERLRAVVAREPLNAPAQRALGRALRALGEDAAAEAAELAAIRAGVHDRALVAIAAALADGDIATAEGLLRTRLAAQPLDAAAIRMMAELAGRLGRFRDAEALLRRALELAPGFLAARANLATVLYKQNRFGEAAEVLESVLARDPGHLGNRNLLAATLGRLGDYEEALALYGELLETFPDHAKLWMSQGHMLKTVGRQEEAISAYRRALAATPGLGEVWWSLANLKTVAFDEADIAAMEAALAAGPEHEDRLHLHFALGKAHADRGAAEPAFGHYAAGNALRREELGYDPSVTTAMVDCLVKEVTPALIAPHAGAGDPAPDPVFILGLPRAGSTLLEQILSSHSLVEGTMELPDIPALAMREAKAMGLTMRDWPKVLARLPEAQLAELGAEYLARTRPQRKTAKPFYIDKLPNNWAYVPFIRLVLPKARIIDARRHPLDCCFSNFRQHFAKGQAFTYGLEDIGRYYADYVRALDHFDRVMPGHVHHVIHESLLADPESEVRALLDFMDLPFEEACLQFHRNTRAVRTASSEQVRRPINRDGVDAWKPYAQWLGPLVAMLGDLPQTYARSAD